MPGAAEIAHLARLTRMAADYHPLPMRCLARSLALARLLGQRGVQTDLRVGVRPADGALSAHAWVEWNGRILNDDETVHDRFPPLPRSRKENVDV